MAAPDLDTSISASAVGEYVYCARAWGLRTATAGTVDPTAAARQAQGLAPSSRPGSSRSLDRRRGRREAALHGGTRAHRHHHRRARASAWLARSGLLLIVAALALGLLPLLAR